MRPTTLENQFTMKNYHRNLLNRPSYIVFNIISYIWKILKKHLMKNLNTFALGTAGIGANEVIQNIPLDQITPTHDTASLIIQIVIALATLFKMFKKQKAVV